jgi:hypothetical protein
MPLAGLQDIPNAINQFSPSGKRRGLGRHPIFSEWVGECAPSVLIGFANQFQPFTRGNRDNFTPNYTLVVNFALPIWCSENLDN